MSYQQLISFNKDTVGTLGWCLDYVQRGYGIGGGASTGGSSAWDSWSKYCKSKHAGRAFPSSAVIPVWFSGTWDGDYYGHVAALNTATGEVYSSPTDKQRGHQVFSSIDALIRHFRSFMPDIQYVGWSEDVAGRAVISSKEDKPMVPTVDLLNALFWRFRKRHTTPAEQERYVGKISYDELIPLLNTGSEADRAARLLELGDQAEREGWGKPSDAESKIAEIKKIVNK